MLSWDEFDKDEGEEAAKGTTATQAAAAGIDKLDNAGGVAALEARAVTADDSEAVNAPRRPWTNSTSPKAWLSWKVLLPASRLTKSA